MYLEQRQATHIRCLHPRLVVAGVPHSPGGKIAMLANRAATSNHFVLYVFGTSWSLKLCCYLWGVKRTFIPWFTDIGKSFTDIGKWFTDIGNWFTDIGKWFTDIGKWFTDIGKSSYLPISVNELPISVNRLDLPISVNELLISVNRFIYRYR